MTVAQLPSHAHTVPAGATSATGGSQPMPIMQPSIAVNYYAVLQGQTPTGPSAPTAPFLGQIRMTAAASVPAGTVSPNGQVFPTAQNPALAAVLGTTYGGGATTFAVPDLCGRAPVAAGQGFTLSPRQLGSVLGAEAVTLTEAKMPRHDHTVSPAIDLTGLTGLTGGDVAYDNMGPSIVLRYIINTSDPLPSRLNNQDEFFRGQVALYAGLQAPTGWMFAEGQTLSIASNTGLFALLGTTYGGNGQSTFGLPDFRGRFAIQTGEGFLLTDRLAGEQVGVESVTLTPAQMCPHTHEVVPEPSTLSLLALAALPLTRVMRRRRK